jgi:hypothetical protein
MELFGTFIVRNHSYIVPKEKVPKYLPQKKKKLSSQNKKYFFSAQSIKFNYGFRNIFGIKYFGF